MNRVPAIRVRAANDPPLRANGDYVLYWCTAQRRPHSNFALQRAVEWCRETGKPLLVFEALRRAYAWAAPRFHRFVLDGMADNAAHYTSRGITYYPYVEPEADAGRGLLGALAERAVVVVADEAPIAFLPRALEAASAQLAVRLEAVDGNGLLPLALAGRDFATAYAFRRFLQKELPHHLLDRPAPDPLRSLPTSAAPEISAQIRHRWPPVESRWLGGDAGDLAELVGEGPAVVSLRGGFRAAEERCKAFIGRRLEAYEERNHPDREVSSGLSPYLHFGHISPHAVFTAVAESEEWSAARLATGGRGARTGWWQMSPAAEAFLDQLVTWRELGYHTAFHRDDSQEYDSLPTWALATLERHASDPRPVIYTVEEMARAATHDPLWNAAQTQLHCEGVLHNYLRMLWGKRILEWTPHPRVALDAMVELNNRFALDGRDPNSYSGIFWVLGRYDRAWGPERPIFGTVRYMSSQNTTRKLRLKGYLSRYGVSAKESADV